jgi:hypothetical protein
VARFLAISAAQRYGSGLRHSEAERLEQELREQPEDKALHLLLLNYYSRPATVGGTDRLAYCRHGMWLIETAPELTGVPSGPKFDPTQNPEAYRQAKQLWLRQIGLGPDNVTILDNAAQFFFYHDPELSETLLRKAQAIEPHNRDWARKIARAIGRGLQRKQGDSRQQAASRALIELEEAYLHEADQAKCCRMLPELARAALEAGTVDRAEAYAIKLLALAGGTGYLHRQSGDAVFHGHVVLGHLALRHGDVGKAKDHLLEAGKTTGSPLLCSAGPDMSLARELLALGERNVVVQFLKLCSCFWQSPDQRGEQWIWAIEHGEMPDFGPNIRY